MKRKHRVFIDVTMMREGTEKDAVRAITFALTGNIRDTFKHHVAHFTVKQGSRFITAEIIKARKEKK